MSVEALLREFARVADGPKATVKLRQFVLNLAVRGSLVSQNAGEQVELDIPSSITGGLVGPHASRSSLYPRSWLGSQIENCFSPLEDGRTLHQGWSPQCDTRAASEGEWGMLKTTSIQPGRFDPEHNKHLPDQLDPRPLLQVSAGDILITCAGPRARCGVACLVRSTPPRRMMSGKMYRFRTKEGMAPEFVELFLLSDIAKGAIDAMKTGSSESGLNLTHNRFRQLAMPVPPLDEQRRIVAKVDELMALCEQLEEAQQERELRRDGLRVASLHQLTPSDGDGTPGSEGVVFFLRQSPRLIAKPEHVAAVRQTILDLAVRGRLVLQDPADEPAPALLARVEKQKQASGLSVTGRDWVSKFVAWADGDFALPAGWEWSRIGTAVERVTVGYVGPMTSHYVESGIPFLRSQNVRPNRFRPEGLISISPEFHYKIRKSALAPGDVVVVRSGNVGTACVVPKHLPDANCSDLVVVKKPMALVSEFLSFYLNSLAAAHVQAGTVGIALTHFNTKSVATMPIPVAPLAEQHRIVAKVDQLMAVCDELEAALASAQDGRGRLLEALLHEALHIARVPDLMQAG